MMATLCKSLNVNNKTFCNQHKTHILLSNTIPYLFTSKLTKKHDLLLKSMNSLQLQRMSSSSINVLPHTFNGKLIRKKSFHQTTGISYPSILIQMGSVQKKQTHYYSQEGISKTDKQKQEKMPPPHPSVIRRLASIEDSLRFHGYSTIRWGVVLLGIIGLTVYVFREYIRSTVIEEVSHVASRSLQDEMVKDKAQQLSVALLHAILSDSQTQKNTVLFLRDILSKNETQVATSNLLTNVLNDPKTQAVLSTSLKKVLNSAFSDKEFRDQFMQQLVTFLQEPPMQEALIKLVLKVLNNEYVKSGARALAIDVVRSEQVVDAASQVSKNLVREVVQDAVVQKHTGDGLYKAFVHSVTPRVFSRGNKGTQDQATVAQSNKDNSVTTYPPDKNK